MSSICKCNIERRYIAIFGIALFCAVLLWTTVFGIAALIVFMSGDATTAQTPPHNCSQFVEDANPGPDQMAPGWIMTSGGKDKRFYV